MRVSYNGGKSKSTKHNSREFDTSKAKHISQEKTQNNKNFYNMELLQGMRRFRQYKTYEDFKRAAYESVFLDSIEKQNQRHISNGHSERCSDIERFMNRRQNQPREEIFKVGNYEEGYAPAHIVEKAHNLFLSWHQKAFGSHIKLLSSFKHVDEIDNQKGGIHFHDEFLFLGHNAHGEVIFDQSKALQELGIERPDTTQKRDAQNCELVVYTAICRSKYQEICKSLGLQIETQPRDQEYNDLPIEVYRQVKEYIHNMQNEIQKEYNQAINDAAEIVEDAQKEAQSMIDDKPLYIQELEYLQSQNDTLMNYIEQKGLVRDFETWFDTQQNQDFDIER